ncbi:MAG: Trm112p-like protein [Methanomassiliicoccales archaeon PtaU1.Bin124]|nr:MAG: Trm112p-like protein [Methanomassiliicoccales archaeon PtaU1.Bin124]
MLGPMKPELMDILACPVCKSHPLQLTVVEKKGNDIVKGSLYCEKCKVTYPIEGSIPNLLPQTK